jgi:hypothetical protein
MRTLKQVVSCLAAVIVALTAGSAPVNADIIDGDFATANLSLTSTSQEGATAATDGWTATAVGWSGAPAEVATVTGGAPGGANYVHIEADSPNTGVGCYSMLVSQYFSASAGDTVSIVYRSTGTGFNGEYYIDAQVWDPMGTGNYNFFLPGTGGAWTSASIPISWSSSTDEVRLIAWTEWSEGTASFDVANVQYHPGAATPEPSTFVLVGISAVSLLAYAWRKRTRTA